MEVANGQYIIEVSSDDTTGITDLIRRFEAVALASDSRRRIAYITKAVQKSPRRERLAVLGVDVRDVNDLIGP